MSTNIHLRGVDAKLMRCLKQESVNQDTSMNTLILTVLKQRFGFSHIRKSTTYHDLDQFSGTWNKQQAKSFLKEIAHFEQIDEDAWK